MGQAVINLNIRQVTPRQCTILALFTLGKTVHDASSDVAELPVENEASFAMFADV